MQEFRALERALGNDGGSAHSSPIVQRRWSAAGAGSHPSGLPENNKSAQVAALLSPAPRAEGLLAPRRGWADDSDDEEDWQDAPLLFGDLYGMAQQPDIGACPPSSQARAGSEVGPVWGHLPRTLVSLPASSVDNLPSTLHWLRRAPIRLSCSCRSMADILLRRSRPGGRPWAAHLHPRAVLQRSSSLPVLSMLSSMPTDTAVPHFAK